MLQTHTLIGYEVWGISTYSIDLLNHFCRILCWITLTYAICNKYKNCLSFTFSVKKLTVFKAIQWTECEGIFQDWEYWNIHIILIISEV